MASGRKLTLRSSDGETFEVDEAVAIVCQIIKLMVEDDCADGVIPLPNVSSVTLSKVLEYCEKHAVSDVPEDQTSSAHEKLQQWDAEFVEVDHSILYGLLMAANFLNIQSLVELSCQRIADMVKGKTPEEIRKTFNIENDFSPEEEQQQMSEVQGWSEMPPCRENQATQRSLMKSNKGEESFPGIMLYLVLPLILLFISIVFYLY